MNPIQWVKRQIPFAVKYAMRRRMEDLPSTIDFHLHPGKRTEATKALEACQTPEELMAFTQNWMGVGSVQIPEEICGVVKYLQAISPKSVCEIGTEHGGTNLLLSQSLPTLERMIGVDLFIKHKPHLRAFNSPAKKLFLIEGSSYTEGTRNRVQKVLDGEYLDVLFIDGDHRYEGVKKDFLMYRDLVREDGCILSHDIVLDHTQRFGKETPAWSGGVPTLWQELKAIYQHQEFVLDYDQDGLGIGVLRFRRDVILPESFCLSKG